MGVAILAPVPASILRSAQETCAVEGRVAFGTELWDFFEGAKQDYGEGLPVLIYPTGHDGDPDHLCVGGHANFKATYLGTTLAKAGIHPNPAVRPLVTISGPSPDGDWTLFWEVSNLVQLPKQEWVPFTKLTAIDKQKPFDAKLLLRRARLVKATFL